MQRQALALAAAIGAAALVQPAALAYGPDDPALALPPPAPAAPVADPAPLFAPTRDGKSGLPPRAPDDTSEEEDPHDVHVNPAEATAVPDSGRAHLADVAYGAAGLPPAAAQAREALIAAALTGDIEALRPIFESQRVAPLVAGSASVSDPLAHLKNQSGDAHGREILAILIEILESGHVAVGQGSTLTYVWPYFAEVPLAELEAPHYVELYRILTAIDVEEMERLGRYTFFRIGIAPDGRVRYFTAGDVE